MSSRFIRSAEAPDSAQTRRFSGEVAEGVQLRAGGRSLTPEELAVRFGGRIAVVIPAYGEEKALPRVLERMPAEVCGIEVAVLVVDDGSPDATASAAERAGATVAALPANRGGGAALWVGYALMVDAGASVVATMDADGQHRPEELERVAEPVISGRVQFAGGSRVLGSAEPGAFARELGIAFFNRLVRTLTGVAVTDCSNGFRAIRTELLPELDLRQPQFHAAEFLIEAVTRGISLEEVPISVLRRTHGLSKKPPALRYGVGFHRAIVAAWRRSVARRGSVRRSYEPLALADAQPLWVGDRAGAPRR